MKEKLLKNYLPHIIAIVLFVIISLAYMSPLLEGKQIQQMDITKHLGMSKEIADYRDETGKEALWTNSMFGGMPAFQISVVYAKNISHHISNFLRNILPLPADMVFLYLLGFYILLLTLGAGPWLSIVGALAFTFSSYHFIIIEAGHNSKAYAIGYMAPVLAGFIMTLRGKFLIGGTITAFFLTMQIAANHFQITYYLIFILLFVGLAELIHIIKKGEYAGLIKSSLVLLAALIIAIGVNFGNIYSTYVYAKHTIRGPSELTIGEKNKTSGLDKGYATAWSYGIGETFSLLIPNAKGGGSAAIGNNKSALEKVEPRFRRDIAGQNHYWGDQPFTSGPVYAGAIVMFLFILSLLLWKNNLKWYILAVTILSVMLAWGKNFMPLTDFFLDYFPGYNKFRAVSMTLVIAELCIPFLAFLGMIYFIKNPDYLKANQKRIYIAFALTGGLALLFFLLPTTFFSFFSKMELSSLNAQKAESAAFIAQIELFMNNLEAARVAIFRADALRSFAFIALAFGMLMLFVFKKLSKTAFIAVLGLLIVIDMWPVNKRYLNADDFVPKRLMAQAYHPNAANKQILQDNDPHFRVFSPDANPFNDASVSYFHKSIGGYHGAKLKRYQEVIDFHLGGRGSLNMDVINMLNTKYFIRSIDGSGPMALRNPDALGNVWFVEDVIMVENADEEIIALDNFDPQNQAIIDKRFSKYLENITIEKDTNAFIRLTAYYPNKLVYASTTEKSQLAVFSEIYYPDGWGVTVNGKPAEHFRANYILRSMIVPEGKNEIVFEFKPRSFYIGETISLIFSLILLLFIASSLYIHYKKRAVTEG